MAWYERITSEEIEAAIRSTPFPDLILGSLQSRESREISINGLVNKACKVLGVSRKKLLGPDRSRPISRPRLAIYHVAYHETRASLSDIARTMERDHTTVLLGIKRVDELLWRQDPEFYEVYQKIARLVA
jgi:chromosomal replication initiation ATPase DnaA